VSDVCADCRDLLYAFPGEEFFCSICETGRDPEHPCMLYGAGEPGELGRCEGDGHYLCAACWQRKLEEVDDDV